MDIKIEKLDSKDADEFVLCMQGIISKIKFYSLEARKSEVDKLTKESISSKDNIVFVIKDNEKIIGGTICTMYGGVLYVDWTGIEDDYRDSGLGRLLGEFQLKYIKNNLRIHKIMCDTRTDNLPAIKYVEKLGCKKIAKLENPWYNQDYYLWEYVL